MSYSLIIVAGFLFAIRGSRQAFSQRPVPSFFWIWREATDLFLTLGLIAALFTVTASFAGCRGFVREYAVLLTGATAYLLTRYQKKSDFFFFFVIALASTPLSVREDFFYNLSWVWVASVGVALFQTGFLGLRYKLLFSSVPEPVKGWPVFCLLAAFVSLALWGLGRYVF